jgi:hypothetical protein
MLFIRPAGKAVLSRIRQAGPTERFYFKQSSGYGQETKAILDGREWRQMLGRFSPNDAKHGKEGDRK